MKALAVILLLIFNSQFAQADPWCEREMAKNETDRKSIMNLDAPFSRKKMLLAANEESLKKIRKYCIHLPEIRENYCKTELQKIDLKYIDIAHDERLTDDEKLLLLKLNRDDKILVKMAMTHICRDVEMDRSKGGFETERTVRQFFERLNPTAQVE